MRRFSLPCVLAAVALLAGCGGKAASPPSATDTPAATATPTPTVALSKGPDPLTSAADLAACAQLEQAVQAVSSLVGHTTEGITQALRPEELAKLTGTARASLLDSAKLIELVEATKPLAGSQRQMARGLRMFAADFGRAKASALKGDMNKAAEQTVDATALRKIQKSAKRIDDLCGA
jgi:PBP1b-binding outer membrane lipoprotein LpoB